MTKTSHCWQSKPGSLDSLHANRCYQSDNRYGIPLPEHIPLWQEQGFSIIPTISWSTAERYPFCFLGVPWHHVVAVAVGVDLSISARQGLKRPLTYQLFMDGFRQMVARLQPTAVSAQLRIGGQFASPANHQL